jgi:hypothetical protein
MYWLISAAIAAYRANPARPHCRPGRHVLACRLIIPRLDSLVPPRDGVSLCWLDDDSRRDDSWCM